jgi:chemotaxis protein methyltransferase CheR
MNIAAASPDVENIAIQLLLEAVHRRYGLDFRDYSFPSIRRRIHNMLRTEKLDSLSELQERLLYDADCMERFLLALSINTTAMFRDPGFYAALRDKVLPHLRTYPFLRIWHVGCSTGEEVYSMAILLREHGLHSRSRIYATDMNEAVLAKAKAGIFPVRAMQEYTQNYQQAGGTRAFSDYYTAHYDNAIFNASLRENVIFAPHNLVTDRSFNEFQVILCRNVMIYFNRSLQNRVHGLLYESLCTFGFLGLGSRESIRFTPHESRYEELDGNQKLYQRCK